MLYRCSLVSRTSALILAMAGLGLSINSGCGILNPSLINPDLVGAVSVGDAVNTIDEPEGYVAILLMNTSPFTIEAQLTVTKENGASKPWSLTAAAADFYVLTQDCDVASVAFVNFNYVDPIAGTILIPANLGNLTMGQGLECGGVIAITATGTPPTFTVNVY